VRTRAIYPGGLPATSGDSSGQDGQNIVRQSIKILSAGKVLLGCKALGHRELWWSWLKRTSQTEQAGHVGRLHIHIHSHILLLLVLLTGLPIPGMAGDLTTLEQLGKQIFFDTSLSTPAGQACASCHMPEAGFTGPTSSVNARGAVYAGAIPSRAGNRKPPSVAYACFSPSFSYDSDDETYVGGQFWDGRALNLVEQAKAPFLNPLEMNNSNAAEVVHKVLKSSYQHLFRQVFRGQAESQDADVLFDLIARALAAYESSSEVNPFSSKYDAYLAGKVTLSAQEQQGLDLFANKANCTACHPHEPDSEGHPPLFTDFTYDNIGAPANPRNPFYKMTADVNPDGERYRDLGLGSALHDQEQWGKVKVPTLRNIARKPHAEFSKAYLHNGVFKSIREVVHFYNARDVIPNEFRPPDVEENVNRDELGDLQLTEDEEVALVAFLETLSDGYDIPSPGDSGSSPVAETGSDPSPAVSSDRFRAASEIARYLRFRQNAHRFAHGPGETVR